MYLGNLIYHKVILQVKRYVIDTQMFAYMMISNVSFNKPWIHNGYSDRNISRNNDNQKIITEYIIMIMGDIISFLIIRMHYVIRSFYKIFIAMIITKFFKVEIQYPIVVNIDNIGEFFYHKQFKCDTPKGYIDFFISFFVIMMNV